MPNWDDPNDPAWDNPHARVYSPENLIKLGRETGGEHLTLNEAIDAGIRAIAERGYTLDNQSVVTEVIEEHDQSPVFSFIRNNTLGEL